MTHVIRLADGSGLYFKAMEIEPHYACCYTSKADSAVHFARVQDAQAIQAAMATVEGSALTEVVPHQLEAP